MKDASKRVLACALSSLALAVALLLPAAALAEEQMMAEDPLGTVEAVADPVAAEPLNATSADAADEEDVELEVQSSATNTTRYYAKTIALGKAVTGTFDYDSEGKFEDYYFKFKTTSRRAQYRVVIDSINGRTVYCAASNEYGDNWTSWDYSVYAANRGYITKSDCDYDAWYYIVVKHYDAKRYDEFRLQVIEEPDISRFKVSNIKGSYAYTGKEIKPSPVVKSGSITLKKGRDYTVAYSDNTYLGTATVTITGTGKYSGTIKKSFKIVKAANPMRVKVKKSVLAPRYAQVRKGDVYLNRNNITVRLAEGSVTYYNVSAKTAGKKIKVDKYSGNITIPKGLKKGTYKVRVKIKAEGNYYYKAVAKTVVYTVKVS